MNKSHEKEKYIIKDIKKMVIKKRNETTKKFPDSLLENINVKAQTV